MKNSLVSVIMCVHNGESTIGQAIDSILCQTYKDFELIVIDDASKDSTLSIIKEYAKKDERIQYRSLNSKSGPAHARNQALALACGHYIAVCDADDISMPHRLKTQIEYLELHQDAFLTATSFEFIDDHNKVLGTTRLDLEHAEIERTLPLRNFILHSSIMMRNVGMRYREKFLCAQDTDLLLRILSGGKKMRCLSEICVQYRIHTNSISSSKALAQKKYGDLALKWYFDRKRCGDDEYESADHIFDEYASSADEKDSTLERMLFTPYTFFFSQANLRSKIIQKIRNDGLKDIVKNSKMYIYTFFTKKMRDWYAKLRSWSSRRRGV